MTDKERTILTKQFHNDLVEAEVPHIVCVAKANNESADCAAAGNTTEMLSMIATIVASCSKNYNIPKKDILNFVAKALGLRRTKKQ